MNEVHRDDVGLNKALNNPPFNFLLSLCIVSCKNQHLSVHLLSLFLLWKYKQAYFVGFLFMLYVYRTLIFLIFIFPCQYPEFSILTILKLMFPLLTRSRPHVLQKYLRVQFVYAKRRLCPHCALPSVFLPNPLTSGCVYYSSSKQSNGSFVCETDCGNTWSPNVIRPQEFHQFDVTNTHICAHKVSVICCFSSQVGDQRQWSQRGFNPSDVQLMFIIAVKRWCEYWEEIWLPAGPLGRNSAVFQCC